MTANRPTAGYLTDPADTRHGTAGGYNNHGCRCDDCRSAVAVYKRALLFNREGTLAEDDPRHGRYTTYYNWRCRCQPCCDASAAYYRGLRRPTP